MRKLIIVLAALALVPAIGWAGSIVGTDHDLSDDGYGTDQICVFCHTPHNALSTLVPLWNHATTTTTFTLYDSPTFDGSADIGQPASVSLACLSCHDGTVAIDSYGGATGTNFITGTALLGSDLSDDHPISFTYNAVADTGLNAPAGGTVGGLSLPLYGTGADQMECGSCHNVHDPDYGNFLRASNAASALCLNCHLK